MIARDGNTRSVWQTTTPDIVIPDDGSDSYDVVIAGGGITGVTLGLLLQKSGKRCLIAEAHSIGYGTTGGTTAHLNTLLDVPYTTLIKNFGEENSRKVADAAKEAIELFKSNINSYQIDCGFEQQPAFLFSQTEDQTKELNEILDACRRVGVDGTLVNAIPIEIPFQQAIEVNAQAKVHPLRYVSALIKEFIGLGGHVVEGCRIVTAEKSGDMLEIETSTGILSAAYLVYATHIPTGVNLLHLRCTPYRSYAIAVRLEDDRYPDGLVYDMYDPYHYYRTQVIDDVKYLIVGGEDHRTGSEENTNGCFLKLESHVRSYFNVKEITHRWSSQYFEPADGLPYIGHLPGNPENVLVATGYGGNGITYSHVAASILKSIVLHEEHPLIEVVTPGRVKPVAGFSEFVRHNAEVAKHLVGGWLGQDTLNAIAQLSVGEGKVVKYEKESLALYKDSNHKVHALNPACTHLHCSVTWNGAEKSWDCPCHGARYSFDGKVLTGPATHDLSQVDIYQQNEEEKRSNESRPSA